jgi:hypothetical protein
MAIEMDGPLTDPGPGLVQVGEFAVNNGGSVPGPQATQTGSQFWMNSDYTGSEPTLAVKALYSDAQVAYDWAGEYAQTLVKQGVTVSPAIGAIADGFTGVQKKTADLWNAIPQSSPIQALVQTLQLNQPSNPSSSPGSASNPGAGTGSNAGYTNTNTAGAGTTTTGGESAPLSGILGSIGSYGVYILGAVVMVVVIALFFFMGKSNTSGVKA